MRKGFLKLIVMSIFMFNLFAKSDYELSAIDFKQNGPISRLEFMFNNSGVKFDKFQVKADKQIILDFKKTSASARVLRGFDTSEFPGSIVFVSAYKKPGTKDDIRVAIQLRDNVRSLIKDKGERLIVEIENQFGAFNTTSDGQVGTSDIQETSSQGERSGVITAKSENIEDILEALTMSGKKKYVGKKISFNLKDLPVKEFFKMIADASGFNVILDEDAFKDVKPLSLRLNNIPWDQALDTIMDMHKLVAKKNGMILTITSLDKATKERQQELESEKVAVQASPLVTKVFPISFATITDMQTILKDYTSERGKISIDNRTNYLIIRDTAENIEKMKKIVEVLDTQTPQVLIESKIVEIDEEYTKEIGVTDPGVSLGYNPFKRPVAVETPSSPASNSSNTSGIASSVGPAFSMTTIASKSNKSPLNINVTSPVGRFTNISFALNLLESQSKAKVVSRPKVITQNKKPATISSGETRQVPVTTSNGGSVQLAYQPVSANLGLSVTPQVTNEGSILLDISVSKASFGAQEGNALPPTFTRDIKTNVLVDNGSTVVVGGVYAYGSNKVDNGIPYLKDIPLVGWLFKNADRDAYTKSEMLIFLTPRIINQKEAGLTAVE